MTRDKLVSIMRECEHSAYFEAYKAADLILQELDKDKPTAPASLVEELREYLTDNMRPLPVDCNATREERHYFEGTRKTAKVALELISRYDSRKEVVLAEGEYGDITHRLYCHVKDGIRPYDGKRGKLIFVPENGGK